MFNKPVDRKREHCTSTSNVKVLQDIESSRQQSVYSVYKQAPLAVEVPVTSKPGSRNRKPGTADRNA